MAHPSAPPVHTGAQGRILFFPMHDELPCDVLSNIGQARGVKTYHPTTPPPTLQMITFVLFICRWMSQRCSKLNLNPILMLVPPHGLPLVLKLREGFESRQD